MSLQPTTPHNSAKIIILSALPQSGKDSLADHCVSKLGLVKVEFKEALHHDAARLLGIPLQTWLDNYTNESKDLPNLKVPFFKEPISARRWLQFVSEDIMKPRFGRRFYGFQLGHKLDTMPNDTFICSDGGFPEELDALRHMGYTPIVLRIYRDACRSVSDTRVLLPADYNILNNDSLERFLDLGLEVVMDLLR